MSSNKRHRRVTRKKPLVNLEYLFKGTKAALIHDMDVDVTYPSDLRSREPKHPDFTGCSPYMFKRFYQVLGFDKRLIWSSDKSFNDLSKDALRAFAESQENFLLPEPLSQRGYRVVQLAKEICADVLGTFQWDSWLDSCSFGKRAAVDLPRSKSYLDVRLEHLNGSRLQWAVFNESLARDMHLFRAVRERSSTRTVVDEIKATTVPKSFKAARVIAPDTTLGGFLSRGLGDYIRNQLERNTHIDLARQPERHKRWAQVSSLSGQLATIDMSKASDSFTWRHIELLVPEDWHHALDVVRTRRCNVAGCVINLRSYMLMGSGHTFPLQTLLFYCLAEAVRRLMKHRRKVSVYGDDIIIPVLMAKPFIVVLEELGFQINSEKSFFDCPDMLRPSHTFFRESCGGDYKGGVDVRPYMPEYDLMSEGQVPRNTYVAWCHKMINGLLDRWEPCEIPITLGFLLNELSSMNRRICFVPSWETDHAGIRHYIPPYLLIGREVSHITYEASYPTYWRLAFEQPKRRRSNRERPYLWYAYYLQYACTVDEDPLVTMLRVPQEPRPGQKWLPGLFSPSVDLDGEVRKDREGVFRWKKREPKRL